MLVSANVCISLSGVSDVLELLFRYPVRVETLGFNFAGIWNGNMLLKALSWVILIRKDEKEIKLTGY